MPPKASQIAWWPKQTPRIGILSQNSFTTSMQIPAFSGLPGPGDKIIASGFKREISPRVILSFLKTARSSSTSQINWNRLYEKLS